MRDRDHHSESRQSVSESVLLCLFRKQIVKMADNVEQTVAKIPKGLIKRFKCGACNQNLRPPIRMCKDGHNFCDICKTGSKCAICGVVIKEEHRNLELENMEAVCINQK